MRNLVLYSKMDPTLNPENMDKVNNHLLKMINKSNPRVGYIASESDRERKYFNKTKKYYEAMGINNLIYIDLEEEYDETRVDDLSKYDVIHLSTGNTFKFLNLLNKRGMTSKLVDYSKDGGILVGVSAGGIIMGKDIDIAKFADVNEVGLDDFSSLDLLGFTVKPHWDKWEHRIDDFKRYAMEDDKKIYVLRDGEAIVVEGDEISIYGQGTVIENCNVY